MTITAVIAEYNPFHNGHAYQLAKSQGADRGGLPCRDYERRFRPARRTCHSRSARPCGAGASWRRGPCAAASVSLCARQCAAFCTRGGIASYCAWLCRFFCFGSEYGDTAPFLELADVLLHEPEEYRELLSGLLRNGLSFPTARAQALSAYFSDSASFSSLSKEELDTF